MVFVTGYHLTEFNRRKDGSSYRDWISETFEASLEMSCMDRKDIDTLIVSSESDFFTLQLNPSTVIADDLGLYNVEALRTIGVEGKIPCAPLISYDDIYVERHFSEETADLINCKVWITNEFQHSGLRDCPSRVFTTLLQMSIGEVALPS